MSDNYTVVLWLADANRFLSFVVAHLLHEGLAAANRGRIDDEIPVAVGVANARRRPMISRAVSSSGLLFGRDPEVTTGERHDYLLTVASGDEVDALNFRAPTVQPRVIRASDLLAALEAISPGALSKTEVLSLFASLARDARAITNPNTDSIDLSATAELCQRVVAALSG